MFLKAFEVNKNHFKKLIHFNKSELSQKTPLL